MSKIDKDYNKLSPFRKLGEMYKMGSNNAKPISSKGSSESVGPPSAKVTPEPVANPTTPSSTIVRTPIINPNNLSVLATERISSLNAQKAIKHALDEEELDSEELGDHVDRHAKKKSKTDGDEKFFIGNHDNDPRLRIFARFKQNGALYICAIRGDIADPAVDSQWKDLVATNNMVNAEHVILDKEVFWAFGHVEGLNKNEKLQVIKKYLTSKKEGTSMKNLDTSVEKAALKYSCDPPYLHVGYFKNDKEEDDHVERVPVQAKVVYSYRGQVLVAAVKFKVLEADAKKGGIAFGGKLTLLYNQVMFLGEYLKDTEEKTRVHIKTPFTLKSEGTVPVHAQTSRGCVSSIILGEEDGQIGTPIDDVFVTFEKTIKNANVNFLAATAKYKVELANREARVTSDEMSMKDGREQLQKSIEEYDRHVEEHEDAHQERVKELETRNKAVDAHQKVTEENKMLKQQVTRLELRIKDLEGRCIKQEEPMTDLHVAQDKQTTYTAPAQALTTEPPELSLKASKGFKDTFRLIPDGHDNAGMYAERQEEDLMIQGKTFKKRRFLQRPSLTVEGKPDTEPDTSWGPFGSIKYSMPDGSSKLVETFSPESLVRYDGRYYIQWVYMKEYQELGYIL